MKKPPETLSKRLVGPRTENDKLEPEEFEALYQTALDVTTQLDRDDLLLLIVQRAVQLLNATDGGIYLLDADRGELSVVAHWGTEHSTEARVRSAISVSPAGEIGDIKNMPGIFKLFAT